MIGAVVLITILRGVIGMIARLFSETVAGPSTAGPASGRQASVPPSEALKKDPACGAFVAPSTAVEAVIGGTRQYFCSTACRDKFRANG